MHNELNLWDYIQTREAEILAAQAELAREMDALKLVKATLAHKAERVPSTSRSLENDKLTIKEMVMRTLSQHPDGGTYDQILRWIEQSFSVELARTSLSPQLSRLKADNAIKLDEDSGVWNIPSELDNPPVRRRRIRSQYRGGKPTSN